MMRGEREDGLGLALLFGMSCFVSSLFHVIKIYFFGCFLFFVFFFCLNLFFVFFFFPSSQEKI